MVVMEAAEKDTGNAKFVSDRCKISIENKVIIDNHLLDSVLTSLVDSLQIYSLTIHFFNTSLEEPGLYVAKEFHRHNILESLTNIATYMDLALRLLCFRDDCISKNNHYNDHLINQRQANQTRKRPIDQIQSFELAEKQQSIRGNWSPPHSEKSHLPPLPKNLWKSMA